MPAHEHLGTQFDSLSGIAAAGYNTDEWNNWQQGRCGTYACALQGLNPKLRLGALDGGSHFFAHDDTHAYDSAGKHPLPYHGLSGHSDTETDIGSPEDWGLPHDESGPEGPDEHLAAATAHAQRHGILAGKYGRRSP